ncbi:hypothetical protein N7504_004355 [Penicillium tannophilum]|nr:hypothetical protein N7504_004355 [Penicillium tannophilum]
MPNVVKQFIMINNGIRTELVRAAKAYKAKFGKDFNLVDCWDRFCKQTKETMNNDLKASIDWNTQAQNTRDRLDKLTGHVDEIYMDDQAKI